MSPKGPSVAGTGDAPSRLLLASGPDRRRHLAVAARSRASRFRSVWTFVSELSRLPLREGVHQLYALAHIARKACAEHTPGSTEEAAQSTDRVPVIHIMVRGSHRFSTGPVDD